MPFTGRKNILARAVKRCGGYLLVKRIIRRESPDIIHVHLPLDTYEKFAKPKKGTVVFHTIHSDPMQLYANRMKEYKAAKWLVKKYNTRFIVLHKKMQMDINKMFGVSDSIILNNGVDVDSIKASKNSEKTRAKLNIPKDAFVIGHIGRFSTVKNQGFLVDVFVEMEKRNKNVFLLLIGEGEDKKKIIGKLNQYGMNGKYIILSNRDDVPYLLNIMDYFVFPSLYEGLPLSLIEAQIAGKPCLVSDAINEYAIMSNLVARLPLNDGAKKWACEVLSYKKPAKVIIDSDAWDIKKITKRLEDIYLDSLNERQDGKK